MALTSRHARVIDMPICGIGGLVPGHEEELPLAAGSGTVDMTVASVAPGYVVYALCCGSAAPPATGKLSVET